MPTLFLIVVETKRKFTVAPGGIKSLLKSMYLVAWNSRSKNKTSAQIYSNSIVIMVDVGVVGGFKRV